MRKSSKIENAPPHIINTTLKAGVRTSALKNTIREASRRRRARVISGTLPRTTEKPRKRSKAPTHYMVLPTPPSTPAATAIPEVPSRYPTTKAFPRYLLRPTYKPIPQERVAAIAPELADTPVAFMQDSFGVIGSE